MLLGLIHNLWFYSLFTLCCYFSILNTLCVLFSTHSVYLVLFLVSVFISMGLLLFIAGLKFFGFIYIVVYVGAIAVLFLFVIMLLDLRNVYSQEISFFHLTRRLFVLWILVSLLYSFTFTPIFINQPFPYFLDYLYSVDVANLFVISTEFLGYYLYNYCGFYLILIGVMLLIVMVGVVSFVSNSVPLDNLEKLTRNKFLQEAASGVATTITPKTRIMRD